MTALAGAAIGAGGAVLAQVTASFFSARHDRTRLSSERDRQQREWDSRARERFLAQKQQLYSEFGSRASDLIEYARAIIEDEQFRQPNPDRVEFQRIVSLVGLIAPDEVFEQVERTAAITELAAFVADYPEAAAEPQRQEALSTASSAWRAMLLAPPRAHRLRPRLPPFRSPIRLRRRLGRSS